MLKINTLFNISQSSLFASQKAIQTIGENIANANTPGYSNREVYLSELCSAGDSSSMSQRMSGVKVQEIKRSYDDLLTSQISEMQQSKSEWDQGPTSNAPYSVKEIHLKAVKWLHRKPDLKAFQSHPKLP